MIPKMTPNSLPLWNPVAPKMSQTASQRGLQKSIRKRASKNSKMEPQWGWGFRLEATQNHQKSSLGPRWCHKGVQGGVPSLKNDPKSSQQAPNINKKRVHHINHQHRSPIQLSPKWDRHGGCRCSPAADSVGPALWTDLKAANVNSLVRKCWL